MNEFLQWLAIAATLFLLHGLGKHHKHYYTHHKGVRSLTSTPQMPIKDDEIWHNPKLESQTPPTPPKK